MTPFDVRIESELGPELRSVYANAPAHHFVPRPDAALTSVVVFGNDAGPHWHYVAMRRATVPARARLSLRLRAPDVTDATRAPRWPLDLLAAFAAHARSTGRPPARGQYLCLERPASLRAGVLIDDPALPGCLQVVGLDSDGLDRVRGDGYAALLAELEARPLSLTQV